MEDKENKSSVDITLMAGEPYEYRFLNRSYSKSRFLDAYHHEVFKGFSQKEYDYSEWNYLVDSTILPILGIIGIIGNTGGIISFSKKLHQTYYCLLLSLAISDLVTILSFICYYSIPHWIDHHTLLENLTFAYLLICAYCILHMSQLIDIYILVALSVERYFAICRPITYRFRRVSALCTILPIVILSVCYSIPLFFENEVNHITLDKFYNENGSQHFVVNITVYVIKATKLKEKSEMYKKIYETWSKIVIKCVIPYVVLISTNVLIIKTFLNLNERPREEEGEEYSPDDYENYGNDSLRLHTNIRGLGQRQSQVNLGFLNLVISMLFLMCYSLIWIWTVTDFMALNPDST
jgi:hypothetical protein